MINMTLKIFLLVLLFALPCHAQEWREARMNVAVVGGGVAVGGDITTGLIGYWKLNENPAIASTTIVDSSGQGNDGTLTTNDGSTNKSVAGKIGQAIDFDGVDDYISVPYNSILDFKGAGKSFSLAAWIKIETIDGGDGGIVGRWDGANYQYVLKFETDTNDIKFGVFDGGFQLAESAANSIAAGAHYHVVGVANAGTLTVYINASQSGTTDTYGTIGDAGTSANLEIGIDGRSGTPSYFPGVIDEVRIYNRALTQEDVMALYNWSE